MTFVCCLELLCITHSNPLPPEITHTPKRLMQAREKPGLALVINHENITSAIYPGNERSMLVSNAIFRLGGTAAIFTTRPQGERRAGPPLLWHHFVFDVKRLVPSPTHLATPADRYVAKYRLEHVVRTHTGADDKSFG